MNRYYCKKINEEIRLDGNIGKPVWSNATEAKLLETEFGGNPSQKTTVKVLWNEEYLYIGFKCEDDEIIATYTEYNDPLYLEEVVEVFIDDNLDFKSYAEFEVNPLNTLLYYNILNDLKGNFKKFARVDKIVHTAVLRQDEQNSWSVEIAIPFSEFVTSKNNPPIAGDKWFVNFYRIDRRKSGEDEYSAWSLTGKINFHLPEKFGEMIFTE
jgi:hypothetical protein